VCAGGRYDGLVEQLGGKPTPALGFAIGMERTILLLQQVNPGLAVQSVDIYLLAEGEMAFQQGLAIAEQLRDHFPAMTVVQHCSGGSLKNQFKKADKSGAQFAVILREEDVANQTLAVKPLRLDTPQVVIKQAEVTSYFAENYLTTP
jgi:histidyl-tRNA synthetase